MRKNGYILLIFVAILGIGFYFAKHNSLNNYGELENEFNLADKYLVGDANGDGKVNSQDYVLVRKHIMGTSMSKDYITRSDTNSDGKITTVDYVNIRKMIMSGKKEYRETGSTPTPTSSLAYSDKNAVVIDSKYSYEIANINVLDFGADPTGAKDSTNAFKNAFSAAAKCRESATCGGTVYAPKGKYLITDRVDVHSYTSLVGDLEEGTTKGTILMIKHGAGSTDINKAALYVQVMGSVRNVAFWYPDQKVDGSGNVTKYPPTIQFGANGTDGLTLENLYFVNSYTAMDFASARENNSIQFIRRIYGTPLHIGIYNNTNYDTIKMENINFSPKYWLNSGLSGVPSKDTLNKALMNSSAMPAAIVFQRLDWFFLANVNIDGYYMGIRLQKSSHGGSEGEMFDSRITDCYYPIYAYYTKHLVLSNVTLKATGGGGARAIHLSEECDFDLSIHNSTISSNGDYAVYYGGSRALSISNSSVTGRIGKAKANAQVSVVGNSLSGTGYEGCNLGDKAEVAKKDYNRRVVTKPKSKNLIKISASQNTDITSKIKDAINKLKATGGIVYIPNGVFNISDHIDVPSGIEIRGAVNWAHHRGYSGSTVLQTTYKENTIFTLQSSSGINGLAIRQIDNENTASIKQYPYVIKGNGSNVYIMNVVLNTVWSGIDLSGCDNHYVEHIWGEFYNIGINVDGGSKNGIIRDSHFTINVLYNTDMNGIKTALNNQTLIRLGNSSNENLLNIFTFGPGVGYLFDGAKDFYAVGLGADYADVGIRLSSGATGTIINPLLVTRPTNTWFEKDIGGRSLYDHHYIESTSNYSGFVKIYNSLNWGSNSGVAVSLAGVGDIHLSSGIIENSASPAIRTSNAAQSIVGMVIGQPQNTTKIQIDKGVSGLTSIGNVCIDGKSCMDRVANNAGINFGNADPKKTCDSGGTTPVTPKNTAEWEKTALYDTSVSAASATTKLCGLGVTSGTLEYKGNCTSTKTATISNDCATITLNACANEVLKYRFKSGSNDTAWKTANGIGKYLIFGQVYNQLLYPGGPASNNASNIGNWVNICTKISDCVISIGNTAVNTRAADNNETFVKRAYQGILGRGADGGGLTTWTNQLNSGTPRQSIISGFVGSQEAIAIYSAWGYN